MVKPLYVRSNPVTQEFSLDLPPGSDVRQQRYAFIGFASDEGVKRNHGREGAVAGPAALRKALAGLPLHLPNVELFDAGDIVLDPKDPGDSLLKAQLSLARTVRLLLDSGITPIVLGGGHETAYGHGLGVLEWVNENHPENQLGIVNWDAHFDLRPLEDGRGTSGTPFLQLARHFREQVRPFQYLVLGTQEAANTRSLFATAHDLGVNYIEAERIAENRKSHLLREIAPFLAFNDYLYLTNCLDVYSAAIAPGVSATNPDGLFPGDVYRIFDAIVASGKVLSLDVAELLPRLDRDDVTAKLAARIIHRFIHLKSRGPEAPNGARARRDGGRTAEAAVPVRAGGDVAEDTRAEKLKTSLIRVAHSRGLLPVARALFRLTPKQVESLACLSGSVEEVLQRRGYGDLAAELETRGSLSATDRFLITAAAVAGSRESLEKLCFGDRNGNHLAGTTGRLIPFPTPLPAPPPIQAVALGR